MQGVTRIIQYTSNVIAVISDSRQLLNNEINTSPASGVTIDAGLVFSSHISQLVQTSYYQLNVPYIYAHYHSLSHFVLFLLSLHSILLQSPQPSHNQSSTATQLSYVNTVISTLSPTITHNQTIIFLGGTKAPRTILPPPSWRNVRRNQTINVIIVCWLWEL